MATQRTGRFALIISGMAVLGACSDGGEFPLFKTSGEEEVPEATRAAPSNAEVRLVDRDVEAPEVFRATEPGLWDGRPSLGGVWVAHPDVAEPERVIIRNESNGKFVIGALFRRERETPGPALQVSSDAAAALDMLAGAPATLDVTALRRQEVPIVEGPATPEGSETLPATEEIQTASLDAPAAPPPTGAVDDTATTASAALAALDSAPAAAPTAPAATSGGISSPLDKPFIQIGLFSVEANANRTGEMLRESGVVPKIETNQSNGKTYYRVLTGPSLSTADRATLLKKVKALGFEDAYFVTS